MERLRLLVLASTYPRWSGDPEPGFVHQLCRRLASTFDVVALVPHATGAAQQEVLDGVDVRRYRYAPARWETLVNDGGIVNNLKRQPLKWLMVPGFLLMQMYATWRTIRRVRPDVVHAHWLVPQGLVVALLSVIDPRTPPFLVTSHGADLFALRSLPMRLIKRFVASRAKAATVVSAAMATELINLRVPPAKISVLSMGVDLSHLFTPDSSAPRSRNEVLFVGRLVEKKGLRHLLSAMPMILSACPDTVLSIVGFGPEEAALREQVRSLGLQDQVKFKGPVTQSGLPALYRGAAVFVAPFVRAESGDQEGLGLVLVEALGCGCPAVVSDLPATKEVLPGSSQPLRVTPADAEALGRAVIELLAWGREPALRAIEDASGDLRARFDWSNVSAAYADVIQGIAIR
ncbi:MAG TPA: glycosyltransferase [Lysobacter sp.]